MFTAKNFSKNRINLKLVSIILVIVLVIFGIYTYFYLKTENNNFFDERKFYVLFIEKSKKQSELESKQDIVKKLGASGEIIFENDYYYLTGCVYSNKDDSSEILKSISSNFSESGVLNLTRKKISKKVRYKIKNDLMLYSFFAYYDKFVFELCELELSYLAGKITQKDLLTYLISAKIEIENYIKKFDGYNLDDFIKIVVKYQNLSLLYLNIFLNSFFESNYKNSMICGLTVNFFMIIYELYNEL